MNHARLTRDEWKLWAEREDVSILAVGPVGTYTPTALAATGGAVKRRAPTWKEMTASAGAVSAKNLVWLVPAANLPGGCPAPKPGDLIRDAAAVDHTVLEVQVGKYGNTHRCTTVALAVVNGLGTLGTLERPAAGRDAAGRPALTEYAAVGTSYCRVQPTDGQAKDVFERRTIPQTFTAVLATPLDARARDAFVAGGVRYTVTATRNPARLDALQELDLEQIL